MATTNDLQDILRGFQDGYARFGDGTFRTFLIPGTRFRHMREVEGLESVGWGMFCEDGRGIRNPKPWHFAVRRRHRDEWQCFQSAAARAGACLEPRMRRVVELTTPGSPTAQWLTAVLLFDRSLLRPLVVAESPEPEMGLVAAGLCWYAPFLASIAAVEAWVEGSLSLAPASLPSWDLTRLVDSTFEMIVRPEYVDRPGSSSRATHKKPVAPGDVERVREVVRQKPYATRDAIQQELRQRHGSGMNHGALTTTLDLLRAEGSYKVQRRRRAK